jgi:hypothetical protein
MHLPFWPKLKTARKKAAVTGIKSDNYNERDRKHIGKLLNAPFLIVKYLVEKSIPAAMIDMESAFAKAKQSSSNCNLKLVEEKENYIRIKQTGGLHKLSLREFVKNASFLK